MPYRVLTFVFPSYMRILEIVRNKNKVRKKLSSTFDSNYIKSRMMPACPMTPDNYVKHIRLKAQKEKVNNLIDHRIIKKESLVCSRITIIIIIIIILFVLFPIFFL